jgi:lysozyme family protein
MDSFERAFELVVGIEAGYVDDRTTDPGGATKYGISKRAYPSVDIANLTVDEAKAIYAADYWQACACDQMQWPLCLFVFDMAINQGQPTARVMLQRTLGVASDGVIGPVTLAAANAMSDEQLALLLTARAFRYMQAGNFTVDGRGWFKRLFLMAFNHNGG